MTATPREYVLGTGDDELARLGLQHRLWSDAAHAAWKNANLRPGERVLDVGCGPGFASLDLAQIVGPRGAVVGVDESEAFVAYANGQAASRGLPQFSAVVGDVQKLAGVLAGGAGASASGAHGGGGGFDLAYARWVLCFVPDPGAVVREAGALVKPGGRFIVHDYFNYEAMAMAPRRQAWVKAVSATARSWRARGGDPDIVARVPRLMEQAGLRVLSINVLQRIARGHESMFVWVDVWWRTYAPKLVAMGLLDQSDCDQLIADLDEVRRSTSDFVVLPTVFEVVGERV